MDRHRCSLQATATALITALLDRHHRTRWHAGIPRHGDSASAAGDRRVRMGIRRRGARHSTEIFCDRGAKATAVPAKLGRWQPADDPLIPTTWSRGNRRAGLRPWSMVHGPIGEPAGGVDRVQHLQHCPRRRVTPGADGSRPIRVSERALTRGRGGGREGPSPPARDGTLLQWQSEGVRAR
ncbi:hypothetical protein K458DRAFT_407342 [Lentithecium fluviatile CBS 122367]|uniref:Uncharacterized protein n=1 Tax=Lentithecium fluviatile CBS 122367 TaxID=1168545 RepID=A0A6G1IPZ7_9PLEO|nr:hypothetical protein K458DRAFT_407342 [Lentithecium fluviatile CBS 122367]